MSARQRKDDALEREDEVVVDPRGSSSSSNSAEPSLEEFLDDQFGTGTAESETGIPSPQQLKEHFQTKSAAIRYLHNQHGMQPKDISKHLGIRYQQVRNALKAELKRGPNEDPNSFVSKALQKMTKEE